MELPEVSFECFGKPHIRCKYILASVIDEQGKENIVFRADVSKSMHYDIVRTLRNPQCFVECLGGGYVEYDAIHKKIHLWGASCQYGSEDRWVTVRILKKHYPDWEVDSTESL